MAEHTHLIFIRDGSLALSVAAALEERLAHDGHDALALVPAVRGADFVGTYHRQLRAWPTDPGQPGGPVVVALDEDGLLNRLEALGLAAYVGVPQADEWRIVYWAGGGAGAILLPVATARDLVEAVARHTPWSRDTAEVAYLHSRDARVAGVGGAALSRKLAAASAVGVAGSLLLAGVPQAASTASAAIQAPSRATAPTTGTVAAVETAFVAGEQPTSALAPPARPLRQRRTPEWRHLPRQRRQ